MTCPSGPAGAHGTFDLLCKADDSPPFSLAASLPTAAASAPSTPSAGCCGSSPRSPARPADPPVGRPGGVPPGRHPHIRRTWRVRCRWSSGVLKSGGRPLDRSPVPRGRPAKILGRIPCCIRQSRWYAAGMAMLIAAPTAGLDLATARFFRVLGDPTRLRIVELLVDRPHTVPELTAAFGAPQGRVSKFCLAPHELRPATRGNLAQAPGRPTQIGDGPRQRRLRRGPPDGRRAIA